jgi:hypothetical protein
MADRNVKHLRPVNPNPRRLGGLAMKLRAALAVFALVVSSPAIAGRVAVITPARLQAGVASYSAEKQQLGMITHTLDELGVSYDVLNQQSTPTNQIKNATINFPGGATRSYAAFIHVGYNRNYNGLFGVGANGSYYWADGYNPDSLMMPTRSWSNVPNIFVGPASWQGVTFDYNGSAAWPYPAACSTGIQATARWSGAGFFADTTGFCATAYLPHSAEVWKDFSSTDGLNTTVSPVAGGFVRVNSTPGINRTIVGISRSFPVGLNTSRNTDDFEYRRSSQAECDSFLLLARYKVGNTANPIIFVYPNAGGGTNPQYALFAMAVAVADSASGRQIIGQTQGWQPKKIAVYVSRAFSKNNYFRDAGAHNRRGLYSDFSKSDSVFFKASIDSLNALDIPITVGCNPESISVATGLWEKSWWKRLSRVEFSPETFTGAIQFSADSGLGRADSLSVVDAWGKQRARKFLNPSGNLGRFCYLDNDTSVSCLLTYARDRLIQQGMVPLSRAICPPDFDHIPVGSRTVSWDSLGTAMLSAGFDHLITNPDDQAATQVNWSVDGNGVPFDGTQEQKMVTGFNGDRRLIYNPGTGALAGELVMCPTRLITDPSSATTTMDPLYNIVNPSHSYSNEFFQGFFGNTWYASDKAYYYHTFRSKFSVWTIRAGELGRYPTNPASAATGKSRFGYWYTKWMVNQAKAINTLAGRTVIKFVYVDEL